MRTIIAVVVAAIMTAAGAARAQGCNLATVLFGKVRIELIPHEGYETGIIFGNDFDSIKFAYHKILGQLASPERDGSRSVANANGDPVA